MHDVILFDIPIYRCSLDIYMNDIRELKEKDTRYRELMELPPMQLVYPNWRYNEIIGWVNISIWNNRIRAEYWLVKQRIRKWLRRKDFDHRGKLFVYHLGRKRELTSTEIFNDLNHKLKSSIEELFPKYHLDTTCFENLGPFIDWTRISK